MKRRSLLQSAVALPLLTFTDDPAWAVATRAASRVRPGDPRWPTAADWESLRQNVAGNLVAIQSPLGACRAAPSSEICRDLFRELKNP
jgi:hypothetical protein